MSQTVSNIQKVAVVEGRKVTGPPHMDTCVVGLFHARGRKRRRKAGMCVCVQAGIGKGVQADVTGVREKQQRYWGGHATGGDTSHRKE